MIIRQPKVTIASKDPMESSRQGGAFLGEIILCILPSRHIRGLRGSTMMARYNLATPVQLEPKALLLPTYLMTPFFNQLWSC